MNIGLKVAKYQARDFVLPIMVYYFVIILLTIGLILLQTFTTGEVKLEGINMSSMIFLFICGLNSFKNSFHFMQALNVTRKKFLLGSLLSFIFIALSFTVIDSVYHLIMSSIFSQKDFFIRNLPIYNNFFFASLWLFALYLLALNVGFIITMLYYKCNKFKQALISIAPLFLIIISSVINNLTENKLMKFSIEAFDFIVGASYNLLIGALNLIICTIILFGLDYSLIRKMVLKN